MIILKIKLDQLKKITIICGSVTQEYILRYVKWRTQFFLVD